MQSVQTGPAVPQASSGFDHVKDSGTDLDTPDRRTGAAPLQASAYSAAQAAPGVVPIGDARAQHRMMLAPYVSEVITDWARHRVPPHSGHRNRVAGTKNSGTVEAIKNRLG